MKTTYHCRHAYFDNEYWDCYLTRGKKSTSIANYRQDLTPDANARQIMHMREYGYIKTYDELPDDLKQEFLEALKNIGGNPDELEFEKPPF